MRPGDVQRIWPQRITREYIMKIKIISVGPGSAHYADRQYIEGRTLEDAYINKGGLVHGTFIDDGKDYSHGYLPGSPLWCSDCVTEPVHDTIMDNLGKATPVVGAKECATEPRTVEGATRG